MSDVRGPVSGVAVAMVAAALALGCTNGKSQETRPSPDNTAPAATPEAAGAKVKRKLVRATPLGMHARRALRKRMLRHGDDMENLLWAALMLDYQSTAAISKWIGEEPKIARPDPNDQTALNNVFPPAFFALQDELHKAAKALSVAATAKDDAAVATAYARLTSTCVRCHSLYLKMPAKAAE